MDERMKSECSWMNFIHDVVGDDIKNDVANDIGHDVRDVRQKFGYIM
jgi:hypothetical protein